MRPHIIIVDTEPGHPIGAQIREHLKDEHHDQVELRGTPLADPETKGKSRPQLLIPVLSTCTSQATQLLASCHQTAPHIPMLPVITASQLSPLINRFGRHLVDFLIPPFNADEVLARVENCLARRHRQLRVPSPKAEPDALAGLITEDPAFTRIKQQLPHVARFEAPVLITGETGTGKELCARALHYLSRRAPRPFLPVNCGALPETLFARELFGHYKGAFTGADTTQAGLVAEAEGGTLFLDEISTLNLSNQAILLRFLQDQTYFAIGSPRPQQASVWIIAATNVELADKVKDGTFRADLFYRLAVLPLVLPPLRERSGDIPLLAASFGTQYAAQHGHEVPMWSPEAIDALCQYDWPGNVRELSNVVQRALFSCEGSAIELDDLSIPKPILMSSTHGTSMQEAKARVIAQFERTYLTDLLRAHQGNVSRAAQAAQKERHNFRRLLKKYRIVPKELD